MSDWSDNPPKTDNLTELRRTGKFPADFRSQPQPVCLVTIRLPSPICLTEKFGHGIALAFHHTVAESCESEMDYEVSRHLIVHSSPRCDGCLLPQPESTRYSSIRSRSCPERLFFCAHFVRISFHAHPASVYAALPRLAAESVRLSRPIATIQGPFDWR